MCFIFTTGIEINVTMEVSRLKKPGIWPKLEPVNLGDPEEMIATEFVCPAAWTGYRPEEVSLQVSESRFLEFLFVMVDYQSEVSEANVAIQLRRGTSFPVYV